MPTLIDLTDEEIDFVLSHPDGCLCPACERLIEAMLAEDEAEAETVASG
ncbi:hypothetical protein BH20PSE1_BH20PSE1_01300 [soil metagenome]